MEGVDGAVGDGAEASYGVEEVAEDVFLGEPAVFTVVVEGVEGGTVEKHFSCCCDPATLNWYHNVVCTF